MSLPVPYYTLPEAAAGLGTTERGLLALAEQDAVDVCFVHHWTGGPVRFATELNGTRELVERGMLPPLGSALVRPSPADLATILACGSADIDGGVDYDASDENKTTWLFWSPSRSVAIPDLLLPQHELTSLKKAADFYAWAERFEPEGPAPAAAHGQDAGGYRAAAENADLPRGERQRAAIRWALSVKEYPIMQIPHGAKTVIEVICRDDFPSLFECDSSFRNAWNSGIRAGLWRLESHASYSKRSFA